MYNAGILVNSIVSGGFGFFGWACLSTNRGFRSLLPLDLPALTSYFIIKKWKTAPWEKVLILSQTKHSPNPTISFSHHLIILRNMFTLMFTKHSHS